MVRKHGGSRKTLQSRFVNTKMSMESIMIDISPGMKKKEQYGLENRLIAIHFDNIYDDDLSRTYYGKHRFFYFLFFYPDL